MNYRLAIAAIALAIFQTASRGLPARVNAASLSPLPTGMVEAMSVTNFGAKGDGVADDTAAIQRALSSVSSRIYVPGGTYRLTAILRIPSNKRLTLAPDAVMLRSANSSAMLLNDANGRVGGFEANTNIVVEGGTWDGNAPEFPGFCTILGFGHVSDLVIRDCNIRRIPVWHGIELNATRRGRVERVAFRSCLNEALQLDTMNSGNPGVFPWFGPYDNTPCEDILIQDCTFAEVVTAIGSHSAPPVDRLIIRRCVADSTSGIAIKPVLYANWTLEDCEFNDCLTAFSGTATGFVLRGNRINNSRGVEMDLAGCRDGLVEGNTFAQARVGIVNASADVVLRGNLFVPSVKFLPPTILPGLIADRFSYPAEAKAGLVEEADDRVAVSTIFAGENPALVEVGLGDTVLLMVAVAGSSPLRFQWMKDDIPIADAVQASIVLKSISAGSAGAYKVRVSSPGGLVTTAPVQVTVAGQRGGIGPADFALTNFSIRATITNPDVPLTTGFGLSGSGSKSLLVRAVGPTLARFGVTDALGDPKLRIFDANGVQISSNDNWPLELANVFDAVGAFQLPAESADAGLQVTLPAGSATAQVWGVAAGVALVELFDRTPGIGARLVNLSARGQVAGSDRVVIGGFSSTGKGAKRLLIRGVGPRLSFFGVGGFLSDPYIELFDAAGRLLASNDNWDVELATTFARVGAFPLEVGSKDAALVATIVAGVGYTVVMRGTDGAFGEALIEIYEVPEN